MTSISTLIIARKLFTKELLITTDPRFPARYNIYVSLQRHPQRNIVLTGFYCSGAEQTGRELARRLRRPFVDVNTEVLRRQRFSTFRLPGAGNPPSVRKLEEWVVRDLSYRRETIINTGPDTFVNEKNVEELRVFSFIVFIDPPFPVLWKRIENSTGLSKMVSDLGRDGFYEMWLQLRPYYELCNLQLYHSDNYHVMLSKLVTHCFCT